MKFMLTFAFTPEGRGRDEAIARFKKTGGQPPAGARLLGRDGRRRDPAAHGTVARGQAPGVS